ncbi:MAG: VWA domain-containing protein [Bryobacterales bacterium]|nr:VWA domain-containing protein [Acidobacteriota bacterium]MCB9384006.1 VWA domain-containing protein [Bryobacterales bacterium]
MRVATRFLWIPLITASLLANGRPPLEPGEQAVTVNVTHKGEAVPSLSAPNFILRQGQMPLEVVTAQEAGPASVVFLVENSAASWTYLQDVNSAMRGFLEHARPEDGYALVSYGREVRVEAPLTTDPAQVARAFAGRTQSSWPDATLYDALDRLLDQTKTLPNRPVIVVIGSGLDRFSEAGYKQLLERIAGEDVVIHAIQLGGTDPALRPQPKISADLRSMIAARSAADQAPPDLNWGAMFLRAITTASGGRFFCPPCEAAFSSAVEQILQSLDADYRVVYRRAPEPAEGKLRVEAFRLADDVRTSFDVRVRRD